MVSRVEERIGKFVCDNKAKDTGSPSPLDPPMIALILGTPFPTINNLSLVIDYVPHKAP